MLGVGSAPIPNIPIHMHGNDMSAHPGHADYRCIVAAYGSSIPNYNDQSTASMTKEYVGTTYDLQNQHQHKKKVNWRLLSHDRFSCMKLRYVYVGIATFILSMAEYVFLLKVIKITNRIYTCWKTCMWVGDGCIHSVEYPFVRAKFDSKPGKRTETLPNLVRISRMSDDDNLEGRIGYILKYL